MPFNMFNVFYLIASASLVILAISSSFIVDLIVTVSPHIVIFFIPSNAVFIHLPAVGAHDSNLTVLVSLV